ncbi:thiamine-phosphate kinase [Hirschia maritima]|uniref:thiamine-phosphate kinase n=1 Tax=Hirschia maritima TaxID=1121961 RepID=UPI000370CDFE|nr:thiamine-phosphate kinase [Hirschia maritima]
MNEFDVIKSCFAPLVTSPNAYALKDDVASVEPPEGRKLIITTDTLVEGVHFLPDDPLESVAQKLVRVNVSDVLAKGGVPWSAVLTLSWNKERKTSQVQQFADGLKADLRLWDISLLGGDTTSTPGPMTVGLTLLGHCSERGPILRSGAQIGDEIWVTGTIGDGALGLRAAKSSLEDVCEEDKALLAWKYRVPELPDGEIARIISLYAMGSADISDGLLADLGNITETSNVSAVVNGDDVPLSEAAQACLKLGKFSKLDLYTGGDDYQCLFTASPEKRIEILNAAKGAGIALACIGHIEAGQGVFVQMSDGQRVKPAKTGWSHL